MICSDFLLSLPVEKVFDTPANTCIQEHANSYFQRLFLSLPLRFHGYDHIVHKHHVRWYYPQGIAFAPDDKSIFISYSSSAASKSFVYFVEYDVHTGKQKRYFQAGRFFSEGFSIKYEGNNKYLYTFTQPFFGSKIGKFQINTVRDGQKAPLVQEFNIRGNTQLSVNNKKYYIMSGDHGENQTLTLYNNVGRTFNNYDYKTDISLNSPGYGFPKRQGFSVGNNFIVTSYGAIASLHGENTLASQIGVAKFSMRGKLLNSNLCSANVYKRVLEKATKQRSTRLENEGVTIDSKDNIYSLVINNASKSSNIFVMKQFVKDSNAAIDFRQCIY